MSDSYPPPRSPSVGRSPRNSSLPSRASHYPEDVNNEDPASQHLSHFNDRRPSATGDELEAMLPPTSPRSPTLPGSPSYHPPFSPLNSSRRSSAHQFSPIPLSDPGTGVPLSPSSQIGSPLLNSSSGQPYSTYSMSEGYQPSITASTTSPSMLDNESQRGMVTNRLSQLMSEDGDHPQEKNLKDYGSVAPDKRDRSQAALMASSGAPNGNRWWGRLSSRARRFIYVAFALLILVVAIAVAIPVALDHKRKSNHSATVQDDTLVTSTSSGSANGATVSPSASASVEPTPEPGWRTAAFGYDGSTVYADDGSTFIYNNSFGGFWTSIPFNDSARAQADVPALNQKWDYNVNLINGVNLGGWLVLEPFIVPAMYEPFNSASNDPNAQNGAIDEWTLSQALGTNLTARMTEHYETFITEKDFAEIAGAGLNWVRLPVGYWMIETWAGEPFLANVAWTYFLKALAWARKYGLRVNIDLHAIPGSQNGFNHSSKQGSVNFLNGVMGLANAQRTLNYIRTITEFITQPEYLNVVPMFSILNEPIGGTIGMNNLRSFYIEVYEMIRGITGIGEGKGPVIGFHDGFGALDATVASGGWNGFLAGADRIALDIHPYLVFTAPNSDAIPYQATKPCQYWGASFNGTSNSFGITLGGEWSLAVNDCGKWLNNVGNGHRFDGTYYDLAGSSTRPAYSAVGSCSSWDNWSSWTEDRKSGFRSVASGYMDSLRHWFFWTWKTGYSNQMGTIGSPMWNYQLGLEQGWIPRNPRSAMGSCVSILAAQGLRPSNVPTTALSSWQTGGAGAGTILATAQLTSFPWPPAAVGASSTRVSNLPTYTPTGSVITMSATTPTAYPSGYSSVVSVGNGWANAQDNAGWFTPVAGCSYPNPWSGVSATVPAAPCTGTRRASRVRRETTNPTVTPAPAL